MTLLAAELQVPCAADTLFWWVEDLSRYPAWLDLVHHAEPEPDPGPAAWAVTLASQLGPLRRSKRLRMVRTVVEPARRARFERREADGKEHAAWVLEATVGSVPAGSRLTMELRYDGRFWGPVLERVLREEISRARPSLTALVTAP